MENNDNFNRILRMNTEVERRRIATRIMCSLLNWIDIDITLFSKRLDMWKLGGNFAA